MKAFRAAATFPSACLTSATVHGCPPVDTRAMIGAGGRTGAVAAPGKTMAVPEAGGGKVTKQLAGEVRRVNPQHADADSQSCK